MHIAKKSFAYYLGNLMIISSLIIFVVIFYPFIILYSPIKTNIIKFSDESIYIPKINAYSKIVKNVDPWNKNEYSDALKEGVAHAKNSEYFGKEGMTYLFAHSSSDLFSNTRTNTPFLRLFELKNDDVILVKTRGKTIRYLVFDKKIVNPSDISVLDFSQKNTLVLQTCWPIGTDWQRLLVFATQI